ncbi:MAG TPA: universal stress protein [Roseiflexaceae bacterium]|nr:universal stress protein [Roseiflexaceae bacterium]
MYRSILVPLDGSALAEQVLPLACDLAQHSGAVLDLVHVHLLYTAAPIAYADVPVIDENLRSLARQQEQTYLERTRDRLLEQFELQIRVALLDASETDIRDQTIPQIITSYAAAHDADLLLMTTHGRGGIARLWLGSVADELVRSCPIPLLLVHTHEAGGAPPRLSGIQKILVTLDGSPLSEQILEPVGKLGALARANYTLLQLVVPHILIRSVPFASSVDFDEEDTQHHLAEARNYLEEVAHRMRLAGQVASVEARPAENVASAILESVDDHHADLLALATHGRSGLVRLVLGSVADKVVRAASVPVLLYRPSVAAS